MKITLKGTNMGLTDSIRRYVDEKIGGLEKFVKDIGAVECWVEVCQTDRHHKSGNIFRAEAQIRVPGRQHIRAEATQWDLHQAIDEVKDDLQQQLKRYKGKIIAQRRDV